jgi:hypothetical protein
MNNYRLSLFLTPVSFRWIIPLSGWKIAAITSMQLERAGKIASINQY